MAQEWLKGSSVASPAHKPVSPRVYKQDLATEGDKFLNNRNLLSSVATLSMTKKKALFK